jgi:hypothetical protein
MRIDTPVTIAIAVGHTVGRHGSGTGSWQGWTGRDSGSRSGLTASEMRRDVGGALKAIWLSLRGVLGLLQGEASHVQLFGHDG